MDELKDYIIVDEVAKKLGISKRRVQCLCAQGRIPFVNRFGKNWAIPASIQKPLDGRRSKRNIAAFK